MTRFGRDLGGPRGESAPSSIMGKSYVLAGGVRTHAGCAEDFWDSSPFAIQMLLSCGDFFCACFLTCCRQQNSQHPEPQTTIALCERGAGFRPRTSQFETLNSASHRKKCSTHGELDAVQRKRLPISLGQFIHGVRGSASP